MASRKRKGGKKPPNGPTLPGMGEGAPKVLEHPLFLALCKFVKVEIYDRDGGHAHPRFRFEWIKSTLEDVNRAALEIECGCARCGATIHPFRRRKPSNERGLGHVYLAVTCPLNVNVGCARSRVAADTYTAIAAALGHER